jgi:hypothetical protein
MSNKITRKGIAVGAAVALAFAGLVGAPSYAAVADVTLTPSEGETYNSIRQSGVVLDSLLNSDEVDTEDALYYTIESTNGANIYEQLNFYFANGQTHDDDDTEDSIDYWNLRDGGTSDEEGYSYYYNTSDDAEDGDEVTVFAVDGDNWWDRATDLYHDLNLDNEDQSLSIWAADSSTNQNLEFTVTAWVDQDGDATLDAFEPKSETRTVKLFDSANVTATTIIDSSLAVGSDVYATTTFNNDINPYFVASEDESQYGYTYTTIYRNGSELEDSATYVNEDGVLEAWYEDEATIGNYTARTYFEASPSIDYYDDIDFGGVNADSESWTFVRWLSPLSTSYSLVAGTNSDVDGIIGNVVDSTTIQLEDTDNGLDEESVGVKSGVKSVVVTSQILDGEDALKVSNVRVKAVVDPIELDNSSDVTVTGTSAKITDEDDADITGFGRTNADGQFVFNVGNTQGLDGDQVDVDLYFLDDDGSWDLGDSFSIYWEDAYLYDFEGDLEVTSGANVTINYSATDQFGGGINEFNEDTLDVTVVAWDDSEDYEEVYDTDVLEKTVALSAAGKASVSFANFASADGFSTVEAFLHESDLDWENATEFSWTTDLYKNAATSEIDSVENVYENEVTYGLYYEGNTSEDSDLVDNLEDYGVWNNNVDSDEYVWIEGQVLTSNGAGAAAQAVTITGTKSMLFETAYGGYDYSYDDSTKVGSITVYTDIDGTFGVYVYSQKHSPAGTPITITSGGKSFKTTLKTFMNDEIDENVFWNGSEWVDAAVLTTTFNKLTGNAKDGIAAPAINTTYNVTATAKDVWGNILEGAEIQVDSDDLIGTVFGVDAYNDTEDDELNGYADTNSKGQITFTVRAQVESYANRKQAFALEAYIDWYNYDDGSDSESYDFQVEDFGSGLYDREYEGITGRQAAAVAGAKKGVVRVHAFNAKGKTVSVFVSGKLVKTVTSDKARFLTTVKGVKAGDKRVTVKVGAKRLVSTFVSVK